MNSAERSIPVPYTSEEDLVFLLSRLGAVTRSRLADTLSSFELTPRQFVVLKTVARGEGLSQTELSDRLGIDTSSIVHVIDECEKGGLAVRQRRSDDRRRYAINLTEVGRSHLRAAQESVDRFSEELLEELSDEQRAELRALLVAVAAAHAPSSNKEVSVVG